MAINLRVELMHLTSGDDERQNDTGKECSDFYLIDDNENVKYFQIN